MPSIGGVCVTVSGLGAMARGLRLSLELDRLATMCAQLLWTERQTARITRRAHIVKNGTGSFLLNHAISLFPLSDRHHPLTVNPPRRI
jgi:hypothetical protein